MTCDKITATTFKTYKPSFSSVESSIIEPYIDVAQIWAKNDWPDDFCIPVQIAVTCHLLTLDGYNPTPEGQSFASNEVEFQSVKSSNVTVTRFRNVSERAGQSTNDWFSQTTCGRHFLVLLRMCFSGPRVVGGGRPIPTNTYTKDHYRDGWW